MPRLPIPLLLLAGLAACKSAERYRLDADDAVYDVLRERRAAFVADPGRFTIDPPPSTLRGELLAGREIAEPLTLVDCLVVAGETNREYQSEREDLFLTALDLTLERWRFSVQESAGATAQASGGGDAGDSAIFDGDFVLSKLFGTGASIVAGIGLSTFRLVSTGDNWTDVGDLSLSITQPILRGFGAKIVEEPLTQAERNVLYAVRSYERFRRAFAVDVANRYFRILQQGVTLANEERNVERLELLTQRNEAFAEAGQLSEIQADQARQDELRARNRVVDARQSLETQLDDFKLFLGLPIGVELELSTAELNALEDAGLVPIEEEEERLVAYALAHRLDLLTVRDRVEDASRRVDIAADGLRMGLDVTASGSLASDDDQPANFDLDDALWSAQLDLDLPIDQIPERNAYRAALVSLDAARRVAEEFGEIVQVDLRDSLRGLTSLRESYLIQQRSVELNERRVESTSLSFEAGRAETRDLLEAQEDLVQAENAAVQALVDHHLALLALRRDTETLRVDETGISAVAIDDPGENSPPTPIHP